MFHKGPFSMLYHKYCSWVFVVEYHSKCPVEENVNFHQGFQNSLLTLKMLIITAADNILIFFLMT